MARAARRTLRIDVRPVIEKLGVEEVIRQMGVDRVIEHIGTKELVKRIGIDDFLASLSPSGLWAANEDLPGARAEVGPPYQPVDAPAPPP